MAFIVHLSAKRYKNQFQKKKNDCRDKIVFFIFFFWCCPWGKVYFERKNGAMMRWRCVRISCSSPSNHITNMQHYHYFTSSLIFLHNMLVYLLHRVCLCLSWWKFETKIVRASCNLQSTSTITSASIFFEIFKTWTPIKCGSVDGCVYIKEAQTQCIGIQ